MWWWPCTGAAWPSLSPPICRLQPEEQPGSLHAATILQLSKPADSAVQDAVALLLSDDRPGAPAVSILTRLLRNIVASPSDLKYRRLRLQNPKIKDAVVDATGGIELLQVNTVHLSLRKSFGGCKTFALCSSMIYMQIFWRKHAQMAFRAATPQITIISSLPTGLLSKWR